MLCGLLLLGGIAAGASDLLRFSGGIIFASGQGFARWIENVESGSAAEKALYRLMQLPGGEILFRRPPRETVPALTAIQQSDKSAALYSLRALEEEQALDFDAAERDWKTWADQASDPVAAHLDLADFYDRRLKPQQELEALAFVGKAPASAKERWTAAASQSSWLAWERSLKVAAQFNLSRTAVGEIYAEFVARYPQEQALYSRQLDFLLDGKDFSAAADLLARYRSAVPGERVFPVEAEAELAARRGSAEDGLAVYERSFEPLWPHELVASYYALLLKSGMQKHFADEWRAKVAADPADLKDAARLFYLYQQQGQIDSAKAVLASYREKKDAAGAAWSAEELDVFARFYASVQDIPEAARYNYALATDRATPGAEEEGLVGLARILLANPDQPLRVGAGNLALYRNIATMDRGPGYLNGILSLLLNSDDPKNEYATEDQRAEAYFHRAKAAELLGEIDSRFPGDAARPELHAGLMQAYVTYGDDAAAIREGTAILAGFPNFAGRVQVAMQLADTYARTNQAEKEFALYQDLLKELAARADGVPLGDNSAAYGKAVESEQIPSSQTQSGEGDNAGAPGDSGREGSSPEASGAGARSREYAEVLNRYLARLVSLNRLPEALNVLRGELDRNPQDPGLYQRLADFLDQNQLNAHEEEVYQRAIDQFQGEGWYTKLARFYLRERRSADYSALMQKVTGIFSGTELEELLQQAPAPDRSLALEVNLYAHERFPHDLRFVTNLLNEYRRTGQNAKVEQLLWEHWSESPALRDQLFELLSRTGRLDAEIETLRQQAPEIDKSDWSALVARDPAAGRFWMEACLWQSHFEQGAGAAEVLASAYPADDDLDSRAASLFRSLAYFHPEDIDKAVAIDTRLLEFRPGDLDLMARIGDTYADRGRFGEAEPYWVRMGEVHPGDSDGYLQSATVFWDYYDLADAQAQLAKARERLGKPTLFGYQSGAIAESRGDMTEAVHEYVASAMGDSESVDSRARLLALARRPELRATVDEGTAGLLSSSAPTPAAIELRAEVLDAEHRRDDLANELLALVGRTSSSDVLDAVSAAAQNDALSNVQEAALRRQIALTTDPVHNLQLRYQLVDFYQSHNNAAAAAAEVDSIYREHGRILGVVRSTVDYDWAHDRKTQAVDVLLDAAQASYPELKGQFQLEAARKLTDLGQFARSRTLLEALLAGSPLDAGAEAAMADNYARANDQAGLAAFYQARLEIVEKAALDGNEKQQRVAQLRRGMISAATMLKNTNEAVDQYIELINSYPDDAALAEEAALYAVEHGARERLFGFYQKTVADSPRDPRWSLVLARLATAAVDFPLAVDAYAKTILLRPERQDLYVSRADLEMRLHRFDDAASDYQKLYTLSYRDPQWMEKLAELRARQGRSADVVKALDTAWIAGSPAKAANSFRVAAQLESWGLLDEARAYAEKGIEQDGADLLVNSEGQSGAATYARILTRQRQAAAAFARLKSARDQAGNLPLTAFVVQVEQQGPGAVTNQEWRQQRELERKRQAGDGFAAAMLAMGNAAGEFYTPEEKDQFAAWLKNSCASANYADVIAYCLPTADAAGLTQLTAELRWRLVQGSAQQRSAQRESWIRLEEQRGQTEEAAAMLEKLAPNLPAKERPAIWQRTADLYRKSGDGAAELRVIGHLAETTTLDDEMQQRFYQLLLARDPARLIALAGNEDSAAQFVVRHGSRAQAVAAVAARSPSRAPVWGSAYTALTGLYQGEFDPAIGRAFSTALGADETIGDRIAHPADRNQQIAGETWFYYGSRYGEFLDAANDSRAEDYLPSELEHTPQSPSAYVQLADYSEQKGRADAALNDDELSIELKADQPAVLDRIATIEWKQGRQPDALSAWSEAVKLLAAEIDAKPVPEAFWGDFSRVVKSVTAHGQYETIRGLVDNLLRAYIARNGDYQSQSLIESAYHANGDSVDWLLSITGSASDQEGLLESLIESSRHAGAGWIGKGQIPVLLRRVLELEEKSAEAHPDQNQWSLDQARRRLVAALVEEKEFAQARDLLARVPAQIRLSGDWLPAVLAVAEADGTLKQLLGDWQKPGNKTPALSDLQSAAAHLDDAGKRSVMRYVYERSLAMRDFSAPNFLGLAAIDLDEGDTSGALELLNRMTLVSGDMDADRDATAHLLEDRKKPAEAIPFLRLLAEDAPWNSSYRVRLGAALVAVNSADTEALGLLKTAAADPKALYADRIAAARALKGHGAPESGSGELQLIAGTGCPSAVDAAKPFFVAARAAAASCSSDVKARERLLRDALAIAPTDGAVRLDYIWAAFAAGMDSRALVAAEPLLQSGSGYDSPEDLTTDDDAATDDDATPAEGREAGQEKALSTATLSPGDAVRFFLLAVRAEERRHDLQQASTIVQSALGNVHDPALRKPFELEQKRIADELAREAQNDRRVPNVHEELVQERLVRTRLVPEKPFMPLQIPGKEAQP
jgi:tetratricopeptide (TPR) repeat protein